MRVLTEKPASAKGKTFVVPTNFRGFASEMRDSVIPGRAVLELDDHTDPVPALEDCFTLKMSASGVPHKINGTLLTPASRVLLREAGANYPLPYASYQAHLWGGRVDCQRLVVSAGGGGMVCLLCKAWYCY